MIELRLIFQGKELEQHEKQGSDMKQQMELLRKLKEKEKTEKSLFRKLKLKSEEIDDLKGEIESIKSKFKKKMSQLTQQLFDE